MLRRAVVSARSTAACDDGSPFETSQRPFFVRRACTSPSGESRCTLRASSSSASRRAGQSGDRHRLRARRRRRASPRRPGEASTGVAVTPSATSFRQPLPSARCAELLHDVECTSGITSSSGGGRRRNDASDEQLVGHLRSERRLGPRDGGQARLPLEPVRPLERTDAHDLALARRRSPRRVPSCSPGTTTHTASSRSRSMRRSSRTTCSSASIRSRRRAASSKRRSRASRLQLRLQLRQRVVERVPLDALQRARGELRACACS